MRRFKIVFFLSVALLVGCAPVVTQNTTPISRTWIPKRPTINIEIPTPRDPEQRQLDAMTLDEKAGQVLVLSYRKTNEGKDQLQMDEALKASIKALKPGGVVLFSQNIRDENQLKTLINDIKALSQTEYPIWIAVDEEGGRVSRMTGKNLEFPVIPPAKTLSSDKEAYEYGLILGAALREYDFDVNFAPIADVHSNPSNSVIGDRAFSSDPKEAGLRALEMATGMMTEGIIPVYKHFPGHGDTAYDSHFGAVTVNHTKERLEEIEFLPFQMGIDSGIPMIMTAHLMVPAYDDDYPATLSKTLITEVLRKQMGFSGIVITDALEMGAISTHWTSEEAAVLALNAGVDLLLMPEDPYKAKQGILDAVLHGTLSIERLNDAVYKVLKLKKSFGLRD